MTGRSIDSTVRLELEEAHACLPWFLNPRVRAHFLRVLIYRIVFYVSILN